MSAKRARLVARATATRRRPQPSRLAAPRRGYRVVAVSLYTDQAAWIDRIHAQLVDAGVPKANRSMVVQEAITALAATFDARQLETAADVAAFFLGQAVARRRAATS